MNVNELHFTAEQQDEACGGTLQQKIAELARLVEPQAASHGGKAVAEHGVRGALALARDGYKELFDDWLPYYRSIKDEEYALQRTLLHIMSQLDDTCIIYRVGYERAQEVKREAAELLEVADREIAGQAGNDDKATAFTQKLQQLCSKYAAAGISPGGCADMLSLTLFADSILTNNT